MIKTAFELISVFWFYFFAQVVLFFVGCFKEGSRAVLGFT